ncbi:MAG: hypothetical protein PHX21_00925 [bacterium]|nr:hypothetical protein [bacterium]
MKTLLSIVAIMATITVAEAKQGIGYDDFNKAISYKYWAEKVGFQGELSGKYEGVRTGTAYSHDASYIKANLTALVLYPIATADKFHLNGAAGFSYIMQNNIGRVEGVNQTDMGIPLRLMIEYYVTDNFAFECGFGVNFTINGDKTDSSDVVLTPGYKDMTTVGYPLSISGSTGLAFHFYFPETAKVATEATPVETPETEDAE